MLRSHDKNVQCTERYKMTLTNPLSLKIPTINFYSGSCQGKKNLYTPECIYV